jgi:aminopeptidase N
MRTTCLLALPSLFLMACPAPSDDGSDGDTDRDSATDTDDSGDTDSGTPEPAAQDVVSAHLSLDLTTRAAQATVTVRPAAGAGSVRLDVSGLTVSAVSIDGVPVAATFEEGWLVAPVDAAAEQVDVAVDYAFPARNESQFDGWMPFFGVSFIWPYFCGNLYPCNPDIQDGLTFTMEVTGVEEGLEAVYATDSVGVAPAYMPAVAIGTYEKLDLGATSAGTRVSAWYFRGAQGLSDAEAGTANLVETVDFYEQVYGPYAYGPELGSVEVDWGGDSWGGMEHHPYSHIARWDFATEEVHAHEAAHGWFGDAVRFECWEDFVLSEGTVTYMAARAMEESGGPDLWAYYVDDFLEPVCSGRDVNPVVLPDETCNGIDILEEDIWSLATYMKGACFYEEVADVVGVQELDAVIGQFYVERVGGTGRMADMIAAIEAAAEPSDRAAIEAAVQAWLRSDACPEDYAARCRTHGNP